MSARRRRAAGVGVLLLLGTLLTGQPAAIAADTRADADTLPWQTQPGENSVVRGAFRQQKHLAELERPLVSTGTFVIARGRGLIWQVEKPVATQLVVTRQQLVERSNGRETARITSAKQPGLAVVAAVLLAVFQGDMDRLRQFFRIERRAADAGQAVVVLRPKTAAVSEFIQQVRIAGREQIERLRIDQAGGDYSIIDLTATPRPAARADAAGNRLSADEKAAFAR